MTGGRLTTCARFFRFFKLWRIPSALFGYFKIKAHFTLHRIRKSDIVLIWLCFRFLRRFPHLWHKYRLVRFWLKFDPFFIYWRYVYRISSVRLKSILKKSIQNQNLQKICYTFWEKIFNFSNPVFQIKISNIGGYQNIPKWKFLEKNKKERKSLCSSDDLCSCKLSYIQESPFFCFLPVWLLSIQK